MPSDEPAPVVNDPRVLALLATKPTSPEDLFKVTMVLVDLKYPQVAKPLVTQLIETAIEEEQLAALVARSAHWSCTALPT
ncbi:MAG: hypothetical protein QM775_31605 [Pirellulales bacterium]